MSSYVEHVAIYLCNNYICFTQRQKNREKSVSIYVNPIFIQPFINMYLQRILPQRIYILFDRFTLKQNTLTSHQGTTRTCVLLTVYKKLTNTPKPNIAKPGYVDWVFSSVITLSFSYISSIIFSVADESGVNTRSKVLKAFVTITKAYASTSGPRPQNLVLCDLVPRHEQRTWIRVTILITKMIMILERAQDGYWKT